jgi:hypothetical protein
MLRSFRGTLSIALLGVILPSQRVNARSDSVGYSPRLNLIKLGASSTIANTIALSYERVLNPDLSVCLTVSYMLPLKPGRLLDLDAENLTFESDRKLTGVFFTPEVKWFLEKSDKRPAPRGLYVGAYLRYSDMRFTSSLSATGTGTDASGSINTSCRIDLFEYGIGPSVGYQFLAIKDRLVIDALFFAPRFSIYTLKVKADLQGDGELASDLAQAIEDKLGRDITNASINLSTTGSTTIDSNSLGYRFGIKVGYAF